MYNDENKGENMDYKEEFLKIYKENIKREGADKLLEWLEKSDFFALQLQQDFTVVTKVGFVSTR